MAGGRPEVLWPLFGGLSALDGIGPKTEALLVAAGIEKPRDMLFTLPYAGVDRQRRASIREVVAPAVVTVAVTVGQHQPNAVKGRPYRVTVEDAQTAFQLVFFHARADFLRKQLPTGQRRIVSGKIELFDGMAQMVHPDHILTEDDAADHCRLRAGVSPTWRAVAEGDGPRGAVCRRDGPGSGRVDRSAFACPRGLARLARRRCRRPCADWVG
jgi:RecG-like helicase